MYIGTHLVKDQQEKDGRIIYTLDDKTVGSATKRQFEALTTDKPRETDDQLVLMIDKFTPDISAVLDTIAECDLNYNDAQFVMQRAIMSLTELQEQALCKVIGNAFDTPMIKLTQANDISLNRLNEEVKK